MVGYLCFVIYLLCLKSALSFENQTNSVEETFNFVEKAQSDLQLTNNSNVTLLIGNTGSGKSTLVHYVAGDYSKLISMEPEENELEYNIYDALDPDIEDVAISTTVSRTIVPEMVIDEEQNVWYDCPGFGDTRNSTIEIATTFLIKSVIENVSKMKIVLVVSYESVTKGHDRQNFDRMLSHAIKLLENIKLFEDSVSMVVTKAPSYRMKGRRMIEVSEDSVKESTAKFINAHRSVLQEKGSQEKKIQLIDAIMKQSSDGDYARISIFWRPPDAGPFNTIEKMIDGRQKIRDSILNSTSFAEIQRNDFGFPLTADTRINIESMAKQLISNITATLTNIDRRSLGAFQRRLKSIKTFSNKLELLAQGKQYYDLINNLVRNETITLERLAETYLLSIRTFGITTINKGDFDEIEKHQKNLGILKKIAETEINFSIRDLLAEASKTMEYWSAEFNWYSFLNRIFDFLGSYEVQKNVSAYNVVNLSDWGQLNKPQGLTINANNFNELLKRFPGNADISPTQSKLNELNEIINVTLKSPLQYECNEETMIIKGTFMKSTDIQLSKCPENQILDINVFVLSTFYVESDLNLNGIENLKIFAPKWNVLQMATFNLNGIAGKPHERPHFNGMSGQPGNVGMNGGNFFGLAHELLSGDLLKVTINGGNGGDGQNGAASEDSTVHLNEDENDIKEIVLTGKSMDDYYTDYFNEKGYKTEHLYSTSHWQYFILLAGGKKYFQHYILHPKCCGATGRGGDGGLGGLPGEFLFKWIGTSNVNYPFEINPQNGSNGMEGLDARHCRNTALRVEVQTETNVIVVVSMFHSRFFKTEIQDRKCHNRYLNKRYYDWSKTNQRKKIDYLTEVIEYKEFLFGSLQKVPLQSILMQTIDALDSNSAINNLYDVNAFVMETNALEKRFYDLNDRNDVLPLYDSLLKRIENYTIVNEATVSDVDKKVLALPYTTLLSKTTSLRNDHDSDLIIDIENFFALTIQNIERLDDRGRSLMINKLNNGYKDEISAKIIEANDYMKNDIQPQIENLFKTLNIEIERTINETLELQSNTIREIKAKNEKAKTIRKYAMMKKIINVVRVVYDFCSGSAIFNGNIIDPTMDEQSAHNDFGETLEKSDRGTISAIVNEFSKVRNSFETFSSAYGSDNELTDITTKLNDLESSNVAAHSDIGNLLLNCIEFVDEQFKIFPDANETIIEPLQKASNAFAVISSSASNYQEFSKNEKNLDAIGQAINQDRKTLDKLMLIEDQIYAELIPMADSLNNDWKKANKDLHKKSSVALDMLQQGKIRNVFRSIQQKLDEMIHGFENEYNLKNCLKQIEDAMNLVLNIFSRVQGYQEHIKFANYLSDLHSADFENLNINNDQLRFNVNQLRFNFQANIVLGQYHRAINGFEQAVFPFAADYLSIYQLPKALSSLNDTDSIIAIASERLKSLSERIEELNATVINGNDKMIYNAYFERNSDNATGPFYVWSNSDVNNEIKRLFSGEKVFLSADVRQSNLNAVKFNTIDLVFQSPDQTTNDQLNEILQSFYVSLTHIGESNYRCDDQFYTIHSRPQTIEYSFSKKDQMLPLARNAVYDKLSNGIALLSPYTLWAMQLTRGDFDKLKPFVDSVDIELHGRGQYVKENAPVCDGDLERFYLLKND